MTTTLDARPLDAPTNPAPEPAPPARPSRLVGLSAVVASLGLLAIAISNSMARNGNTAATTAVFYVAVAVVFAAFVPGLLRRSTTPAQRLALVVLFAVALYLIKVLYEPSRFALHDELAQARGTDNILGSTHLFGANPIVRAYPYFPGLNAATAVIMHTTHLSQFWSGTVLIGAARVLGAIGLYELLRRLTGKDRLAAAGVLLYATNPNFLYFDSAYSYESLAIPFAVAVLLVTVDAVSAEPVGHRYALLAVAAVLSAGLVLTHHISAYWLAAVLVGWLAVTAVVAVARRGRSWVRPPALRLGRVVPFAGVAVVGVLAWQFGVARSHTSSEIDPAVSGAGALFDKLTGQSKGPAKQLFASGTGQLTNPLWAQALALAAVAFALVVLVLGLWSVARRTSWRHPLVLVLSLLALLLPVTLALRITQEGTETSNRASEFVYFGLALVGAAVLVGERWRHRGAQHSATARPRLTRTFTVVGAALVVMFLGGFVIGWAPYERQPGPYLGAAELRSADPASVQAAKWTRRLPAGTFIAADLSNGLLMASYARVDPQSGTVGGQAVSRLFYSSTYDTIDARIVSADKIRYIVVDSRMAKYPPQSKGYFAFGVPAGVDPAKKLPAASLAKFERTSALRRVYDNGTIRIYAVTGVTP